MSSFFNLSNNPDWMQFRVTFQRDAGDKYRTVFDCFARDAEGACDAVEDAFPSAQNASAVPFEGDLIRLQAADLAKRYAHAAQDSVTTLITEPNTDADVSGGEVEMMVLRLCGTGDGAHFTLITEYGDPIGDVFTEIGVNPQRLAKSIPVERLQALECVRDVFIAAYATGDGVRGPDYMHMLVSEQFLQKLKRLQTLCEKEGLTEVRVQDGPTWGADRDEADLSGMGELVVSMNGFYFSEILRHCDEEFQSRGVGIDDFCAQVRAMTPKDTLLLCDVVDPCEKLLEDLGYEFSEDSDQPGLWVWMAPSDACDSSFSTRAEAVRFAWQDAASQTCSIRCFDVSAWEGMSIPEQILAISDALSEEPFRERE